MVERILVALDNSVYADTVMERAVLLAKTCGAHLVGISVVDHGVMTWIDASGVVVMPEILEAVTKSFESRLERLRALAKEAEVPIETVITHGNPSHAIIDYARDNDIDLIVLGHVGRAGADRFLLGSVAYKVANYAQSSVYIVR